MASTPLWPARASSRSRLTRRVSRSTADQHARQCMSRSPRTRGGPGSEACGVGRTVDSSTESEEEAMPTTTEDAPVLDPDKLMSFVFRAVGEVGATLNTALVVMGDKLGLYRALAGAGPLTPAELAERTGTNERYVREWLNAQAAGSFVTYDPDSGRYTLPPEQTVALTDETSPAYLPGFFQLALGSVLDSPRVADAARTGSGIGWHDHVHDVHEGCERFFRPGYNAHLITEWLPALDGVVAKLERGASVADVGCGHGASTLLMAQAFPASTFVGFDYHDASIATARERASQAGLAQQARFETSPSTAYPGRRLRPGHHVRLPARHGRPRRRRPPRPPVAGVRRHVDDRRTRRRRPGRGQPEPGGPGRTTPFRHCCAHRVRCPRTSGWPWEPKRERRASATSSPAPGSERFRRVAETPFNIVYEARL